MGAAKVEYSSTLDRVPGQKLERLGFKYTPLYYTSYVYNTYVFLCNLADCFSPCHDFVVELILRGQLGTQWIENQA